MSTLILTRRDVAGFVSAALIGRYCRYHLFEDLSLDANELVFTNERRLGAVLRDAVPLAEGTLTRIYIAGLGEPEDLATALAALERLEFLGTEVEWIDHRPWSDPAIAARIAERTHLVLPSRTFPSPAQFVHDALRLSDHRSCFLVEAGSATSGAAWHLLLTALTHEAHQADVREHLRRLAFGSLRFREADEGLVAEELERMRWLERDLRLLVPFPVEWTRTRQSMALVDLRKETGAPLLRPGDIAMQVSRSQPVRYTFVAVSHRDTWAAHLYSWPGDVGNLAAIPNLDGAAAGTFRMAIEARNLAVFDPLEPGLSFRELAHAVAGKL